MSAIAPGDRLEELVVRADLATSVRYAGASGDFNPLHYDASFAATASPTGEPIAHGMYALGVASRLVTAFAGGPGAVLDVDVRFPRPWPLGTEVTFTGRVLEVADGIATVEVTGTRAGGGRVLKGRARIRA